MYFSQCKKDGNDTPHRTNCLDSSELKVTDWKNPPYWPQLVLPPITRLGSHELPCSWTSRLIRTALGFRTTYSWSLLPPDCCPRSLQKVAIHSRSWQGQEEESEQPPYFPWVGSSRLHLIMLFLLRSQNLGHTQTNECIFKKHFLKGSINHVSSQI